VDSIRWRGWEIVRGRDVMSCRFIFKDELSQNSRPSGKTKASGERRGVPE
jgi:hypothetical protein